MPKPRIAQDSDAAVDPTRAEVVRLFGLRAESAVRLAFHLTRDREAALDLTQEAFVRAIEALPSLEDPARATAWFQRVVVNLCRDWLRRGNAERKALRVAERAGLERAVSADPAVQSERSDAHAWVRAALLDLPQELREAIALVCVEGCEPKVAAEVLGIPDGTLRWRLHEGRRLLKDAYER